MVAVFVFWRERNEFEGICVVDVRFVLNIMYLYSVVEVTSVSMSHGASLWFMDGESGASLACFQWIWRCSAMSPLQRFTVRDCTQVHGGAALRFQLSHF